MNKIVFLLLLFETVAFGQKTLTLSGQLTVQFGDQIVTPENVIIELFNEGKITSTDSSGYFKFENLKDKEYELRVLNYSANPKIFKVALNGESKQNADLFLKIECQVNSETAKRDIEEGYPKLLLASGIAPSVYFKEDPFEKKYGVKYEDFGDVIEHPYECMAQYNQEIFKFLDKKFGQEWRKMIREDVIGFK